MGNLPQDVAGIMQHPFSISGRFLTDLSFSPAAVLRAVSKGQNEWQPGLYLNIVYDDELLSKPIGDLREYVGIYGEKKNAFRDYLSFAIWTFSSLLTTFLFFFCLYLAIAWLAHKFR